MTKIVINEEQGGFQLSQKAIQKLIDEHGYEKTRVNEDGEYENPDAEIVSDEGVFEDKDVTEAYLMNTFVDSVRADPSLVQVVEELVYLYMDLTLINYALRLRVFLLLFSAV